MSFRLPILAPSRGLLVVCVVDLPGALAGHSSYSYPNFLFRWPRSLDLFPLRLVKNLFAWNFGGSLSLKVLEVWRRFQRYAQWCPTWTSHFWYPFHWRCVFILSSLMPSRVTSRLIVSSSSTRSLTWSPVAPFCWLSLFWSAYSIFSFNGLCEHDSVLMWFCHGSFHATRFRPLSLYMGLFRQFAGSLSISSASQKTACWTFLRRAISTGTDSLAAGRIVIGISSDSRPSDKLSMSIEFLACSLGTL